MDTKLTLKPVELIDIGIDKHTKIPMPILSNNVIYTNDVVNGIPINTFTMTIYSNTFSVEITTERDILLTFDFGDGTTSSISGTTIITGHTYSTTDTRTIQITGDLTRIIGINCNGCGLIGAYLNKIKKLSTLNLSGNTMTEIDIFGMVNLKTINFKDNYLTSSAVDDIIIQTNTFVTYSGILDLSGTNNGYPSIYSENDRNNLFYNKMWALDYNIVI